MCSCGSKIVECSVGGGTGNVPSFYVTVLLNIAQFRAGKTRSHRFLNYSNFALGHSESVKYLVGIGWTGT